MRPVFQPFDPLKEVRVYLRNLPHWRQEGCTYFVTFRQDDSIPQAVLAEWLERRQRWYRAHEIDPAWSEADPERMAAAYQRIPAGVRRAFERAQGKMLHEELDRCHGSCVLRHRQPQQIVADSLTFFHGQRLWLGDFVVMPNHVHALIVPFEPWELEDLLGSIKKWSSRQIGLWLQGQPAALHPAGPQHSKPRFWQHESYDRIVRDPEELMIFRGYMVRNPTVAGLGTGEYTHRTANWLDPFAPLLLENKAPQLDRPRHAGPKVSSSAPRDDCLLHEHPKRKPLPER